MKLIEVPYLCLIPLLPLVGAFVAGVFGSWLHRRFGERVIAALTVTPPWVSCLLAVRAVVALAGAGPRAVLYQKAWSWIAVGSWQVDLAFAVDRLSAVMILVVTLVGSLIHVYSMGYMRRDPSYWRFFAYLNLFMAAMLVLVLGDGLLLAFVGWEGVGLCSYLLIGFWYQDPRNAAAGMKAFIVNRIGDAGFLLGMFLLFWGLAVDAPNYPRAPRRAPAPAAAPAPPRGPPRPVERGPPPAAVAAAHGASFAAAQREVVGAEPAEPRAPRPGASARGRPAPRGATARRGSEARPKKAAARPERRGPARPGRRAAAAERPDGAARVRAPRAAAAGLPDRSLAFRDLERIVAQRRDVPRRQWLGVDVLTLAALLLFAGAMGKSAQVPLHVWLPDAMAGPTPVSALIHAATMVTAGVYLVARMHFVFATSPVAMTVVTMVGALTALFAATIGVFQHDIKKVLAYSTVSQLGFMFVAVGVGAYWVGIFHLMTHAFFKACLFLGSGSVILGCHHEQDMRRMGGLRKLMPITAATYLLSCFAIAGFPPFSGFFSKDEILWRAFDAGNLLLPGGGSIPWVLITVAALLTSFYMFRSYYLTFSGSYRGGARADDGAHGHDAAHGRLPHESPWSMTGVLAVLAALAAVGGFVGLPPLWGLPNWFERWLEPVFVGSHHRIESAGHGHGLEWALMGFSVAVAVTGFLFARWLYRDGTSPLPARLLASESPAVRGVHRWVYGKYFVDELYEMTFVRAVREGSRALAFFDARVVDGLVNLCGAIGRACGAVQGLIDRWLVDGLVNLVGDTLVFGGRALRTIQTGLVQAYLYVALAGAVVLILIAYAVQ